MRKTNIFNIIKNILFKSEKQMSLNRVRVGRYLIYGIIDPSTGCLGYIGKTHKKKENRLEEHIIDALNGSQRNSHLWIKSIINKGYAPEIFIIKKIDKNACWKTEEKNEIKYWKNIPENMFPIIHVAQTHKSKDIDIRFVDLKNTHHISKNYRI